MGKRTTEIAIVGGGAMGLAAAHALAVAGRRVVVLEQFRVGHSRGSSHGTSRIFRLVYDQPRFVAMAQAALSRWRRLEEASGERLLTTTGSLDIGSDLTTFAETLEAAGVRYELVDAGELGRLVEGIDAAGGDQCLLQRDGGIVHADRAVEVLRKGARAHGAEIFEETRVRELDAGDGRVVLRGDGLELHAETAVVAAGAWSAPLLATAGIDVELSPTRETVAYLRFPHADALPTVIDHDAGVEAPALPRLSDEAYGLASPGQGLKVGIHQAGAATDPDEEGRPDEPTVAAALEWASRVYGVGENGLLGTDTCIYTSTVDSSFLLERHGRIVVAAACSGHGFKFVPEIGRRLADLAAEPVIG